jgi:hypothetical protein
MKHIKLFRLFESELSENNVDISGLFTSSKWTALCEAMGIRREEITGQEVGTNQKVGLESGVNIVLPDDDKLTAVKLTNTDLATPSVPFQGNDDFEYFKKFIVKPLRTWDSTSPAKLLLASASVIVSGKNKEMLSIRLRSTDPRRDIKKDIKGGFRSGVVFAKDIPSKYPDVVEGIVAEALINVSVEANKEYFEKEHSRNSEKIQEFNLFTDIVSGMIASACGRPELGPGEGRRKEIHDIILNSGDHRVMNFVKKYYSDLWEEIQTSTGGGAETLSDLTELGF